MVALDPPDRALRAAGPSHPPHEVGAARQRHRDHGAGAGDLVRRLSRAAARAAQEGVGPEPVLDRRRPRGVASPRVAAHRDRTTNANVLSSGVATEADGLKITRVTPRAVAEPGGRHYLVVRVETDQGFTGYAETQAASAVQVAVDRLKQELHRLVGVDPSRALRVDEELRRARASHEARAVANVACLDILGKATRAPVYEVLGGPTRHKVRALASVAGGSDTELHENVLAAKRDGYRAFSIPLTMPPGMERGRRFYADIRANLDRLREAAGEECDFVLDCGGRTAPGEALSIADRLEGFHLLWMDEPCGETSTTAQASISKGSVTAVGFGRGVSDNARFQDLLREDGVDVLRPALAIHGLTSIRKAAAIAETSTSRSHRSTAAARSGPRPGSSFAPRCRTPSSRRPRSRPIAPLGRPALPSAAGTRSPSTASSRCRASRASAWTSTRVPLTGTRSLASGGKRAMNRRDLLKVSLFGAAAAPAASRPPANAPPSSGAPTAWSVTSRS